MTEWKKWFEKKLELYKTQHIYAYILFNLLSIYHKKKLTSIWDFNIESVLDCWIQNNILVRVIVIQFNKENWFRRNKIQSCFKYSCKIL
jgi:hypothetical protein